MNIVLRPERAEDHRRVEEVTREAFWNVYQPGCEEHLLVHKFRNAAQFIAPLDYVAIVDGKIVGNIIYLEAAIDGADGHAHKIAVFGPVSVLPEYQGKGVGGRLITHTMQLAGEMGYKAVIIYGFPDYYGRFGFKASKEFGITNGEGKFPAAMLVRELYEGSLTGISGSYNEGDLYINAPDESEEFDKGFPPREKVSGTKSQAKLLEMVDKFL